MAKVAKEKIEEFYSQVRDDGNDVTWATFKYDGKNIVNDQTGTEFEQLYDVFIPGERVYAYVRFQTGDELSIRSKFALITYIGDNVSALKRGIMSTDKSVLKDGGIKDFAKEFHFEGDAREHIHYDEMLAEVKKVGGANYDAQKN